MARALHDAAGEPRELWIVPGAGHGEYFTAAPADWRAHVVGFYERTLLR